jgi:hypothetical protein
MSVHTAREWVTRNPFYVLDLPVTTTRSEVERVGQRLLAQLGVGAEAVKTYRTPLGEFERTADLVRHAVNELRDPASRLRHEIWRSEFAEASALRPPSLAYPDAAGIIGWRNAWLCR